jgi:hypothetical protein
VAVASGARSRASPRSRWRSLRAFSGTYGLEPALLDIWIGAGLVAKTAIVTDALRGASLEIVALTPAGARALGEVSARNVRAIPPSRLKHSGAKLVHDAGVGEIALAFMSAAHAGLIELLGVETDDSALATSVAMPGVRGAVRVPLKADAYVLLRGAQGPTGLLVEYDRATIAAKRMAEKFSAYAEWRRSGGPARSFQVKALRVLTVVPDARRLEKLHAAALESTHGKRSGFLLFAEARHFTASDPGRLTEPVVRRLGDETFLPLIEAPTSPGVARHRLRAAA